MSDQWTPAEFDALARAVGLREALRLAGLPEPPTDRQQEETPMPEKVSYQRWREMFTHGPAGIAEARRLHAQGLVDNGPFEDSMRHARQNEDMARPRPEHVDPALLEPIEHEDWKALFRGTAEDRALARRLHAEGLVVELKPTRPGDADGEESIPFDRWAKLFSGSEQDRALARRLHAEGKVARSVTAEPATPPVPDAGKVPHEQWRAMFSGTAEERAEAIALHGQGRVDLPGVT